MEFDEILVVKHTKIVSGQVSLFYLSLFTSEFTIQKKNEGTIVFLLLVCAFSKQNLKIYSFFIL